MPSKTRFHAWAGAALVTLSAMATVSLVVAGLSLWAEGPDAWFDAPRDVLTFHEEMEIARPTLLENSGQIIGIWKGPGLSWDVHRWEPTDATKRRAPGNQAWPVVPAGACDSLQECEDEMDDACTDAGHGGVDTATVQLVQHANGSVTCSGDCNLHGAIAFQICGPVS
ncbi:MAG: hypothetical protein V3S82_10340 [Dehalococcoidia bacterium]